MNYLITFLFLIIIELVFSQELKLILPLGHTESINKVSISDDGERVLSVSEDRLIKLWDVKSGRQLLTLDEHNCNVLNGDFFPESKDFITAGENGEIKIWNAIGELQRTIHTEQEEQTIKFSNLNEFILSKSGEHCFAGSEEGIITAWAIKTGELQFKLKAFNVSIRKIVLDEVSQTIVVIPTEGNPLVINAKNGEKIGELIGHNGRVKTADFSSDGSHIAIGGVNNELHIYSMKNLSIINQLVGHDSFFKGNKQEEGTVLINNEFWINALQFNADGSRLLSVSDDGTGIVWDIQNGKIIQRLNHSSGQLWFCDFHPDGKTVLTSSFKKTKVWELESGKEIASLDGSNGEFIEAGRNILTITSVFNDNQNINDFIFWNTNNYKISKSFVQISNEISEVLRSNDDTKIVQAQLRGGIRIWDTEKGKVRNPLTVSASTAFSFCQDLKGQKMVFCTDDSILVLYDLQKLQEINRLSITAGRPNEMFIDKSGSFIVCLFTKGYMELRSLSDLSLLHQQTFNGNLATVQFTEAKIGMLITLREGIIQWVNLADFSILNEWKTGFDDTYGASLSNDGRYLMTYGTSGYKIQDLFKGNKTILKDNSNSFYNGYFSENSQFALIDNQIITINDKSVINLPYFVDVYHDTNWRYFVYTTNEMYNDSILVVDWKKDEIKNIQRKVHNSTVNDIKFSNDGSFFYSVSADNSMKKWDTKSGELISVFYALSTEDYLVLAKNGFYQCSKNTANLIHYVTKDLEVISFDQLDIKYNRPDIIIESLNKDDTLLINSYFNAYLKRLKRLNIDTLTFTDNFSFPSCEISTNLGLYEVKKKELSVRISASERSASLDRINIWVNEVPIYGERGLSLRNLNVNQLDTFITILLSEGENRIEASVTNSNAIESFRSPIYVRYIPEKNYAPKTHFIGIGIDQFKEEGHDLSYSVKDVRDLAKAMKAKLGDQLTIDTLFNQNVSISNVQALKKRLLETNINDKVIISYSGHGLLSKEYDYYLSSYTVNFQQPEIGGIPYEVLEDLLDSIPARHKLLLIDACHSGEVDKDDFREMAAVAGAKGIVQPKGGDAENTSASNTVGLQNSFQLMQELFVNVQKGSGATIISAAAGDQFALEGGKLKNGFFTYAILQYIANNQSVGINELKRYVYAEVERLSGGLQKPTSRIENLELDWRMW